MNPTNSVFIPQSLVQEGYGFKLNFNISKLVYFYSLYSWRDARAGERHAIFQLDSSPILPRLRHFRSRLRNQNKSTRARNPASYAGYISRAKGLLSSISAFVSCSK